MSTPKNPGPRLPDRPAGPPTITGGAAVATPPTSVLERLKAAQPRAAAAGDAGGVRAPGAGTTGAGRTATPGPAGVGNGGLPSGGTGVTRGERASSPGRLGADRGGRLRVAADRSEQLRLAVVRSERLRLAADRANTAARVTGTAIRRGSTATVRHVGSWHPDTVRQSAVTLCAVACILGSAAGVGAFGGPSIRDAAGGLFAPDATLLAPSSSAFSIWSVIYGGLVAYTAFQWLPSQRTSERQRELGWAVAASMLLNLAWILSAQADHLTLSLVVILLLLVALVSAVRTLNEHLNETRLEGALVDTPIGLYLGWVLVAAAANAAAFLTDRNTDLFGWKGSTWAILGIIAVLLAAAVICSTDRGRLSVAAGASWGLLWIAVERVLGEPFAVNIAFAAALAIFLLLITAGSRRHRIDHAYRHWLRAEEDAKREPLDLLGGDYEDSRH
ncbi:tryptophan-rich sensory protein [Arthrobacter sedimenti]|uniref:tryptophan-rich sensory protein n=1 Tax=Arthrobacter sedimenti TaxID=2694931 RepID=UPI00111EAFA6|nr:tryptophan-rich sensory protein [Arthrobacter sedimenti]